MVDETDKGSHVRENYRGSRFRRRAELIVTRTNADREEFLWGPYHEACSRHFYVETRGGRVAGENPEGPFFFSADE